MFIKKNNQKKLLLLIFIISMSFFCKSNKTELQIVNFYKDSNEQLEISLNNLKKSQINIVKSIEALKSSKKLIKTIAQEEEKLIRKFIPSPTPQIDNLQNKIKSTIQNIKTISSKILTKYGKYQYFQKQMQQ